MTTETISELSVATTSAATTSASTTQEVEEIIPQQKVFFFHELLLRKSENLKLRYFYHPGKGKLALFIADPKRKKLFEVKEFSQPHRSWLINKDICSNGKVYITVPFDCNFLAFHYLKKYCSDTAMALEDFVDPFLAEYANVYHLYVAADMKKMGERLFFKYNRNKTLAWLAVKVRYIAIRLKRENIYCGVNSLSQNYDEFDQKSTDREYLEYAFDIVGSYVDSELHDQLAIYIGIKEIESKPISPVKKKFKLRPPLSVYVNPLAPMQKEE